MSAEAPLAITGGTGFVGKAVRRLAKENSITLRALARKVPEDAIGVDWVEGDLANNAALAKLADGASAIIHIAGLTNTPDPAQFDAVNVEGTANVIAAAKAAYVSRFIFVSSLSARKPDLSQYGASKARAEELVKASGLTWTIIRPPAVYGPHDIDMFELFRTAKWGIVPLPPGGTTSIIHVDDLARLVLALTPSVPAVNKHMFEPDDGREGGWSHKELGAAIGRAMRRRVFAPHLPRSVLESAAKLDRAFRGKKAKLTQDRVGYMCHPNWVARFDRQVPAEIWQPRLVDEEGLRATAQWYRDNNWL
ncbi:MAG TPA: epimerase [Erythrobacter sp.]|nr:epimerase [Erythrobacter sp.]